MVNLQDEVDRFISIVESVPNISEGNLQLELNVSNTKFYHLTKMAQSKDRRLKRYKKDGEFRFHIIEDQSIQTTLEKEVKEKIVKEKILS